MWIVVLTIKVMLVILIGDMKIFLPRVSEKIKGAVTTGSIPAAVQMSHNIYLYKD